MKKKLTLEKVNSRLKEKGIEYACTKYSGRSVKDSEFKIFLNEKEFFGKSSYSVIESGHHPSWSPLCKSRKDKNETIVNEELRIKGIEYVCIRYEGSRSAKSVFKHIKSGIEGESVYSKIAIGQHPSWSPDCKRKKNKNANTVNKEFKAKGIEYECIEYNGSLKKSVFKHISSGKEGESNYWHILNGTHPSWSPACKSRQDINEVIVNEKLKDKRIGYKCIVYKGRHSAESFFEHTASKVKGKSSFGFIVTGGHPSWSPECKSRKDKNETIANEELNKKEIQYKCISYQGRGSNKSIFEHLKSGKQGKSTYVSILNGKHPSWSPECKSRKDIDAAIINERLIKLEREYVCVYYSKGSSRKSKFIHTPTNTGPHPSRYSDILNGKHPSWSPACKSRKDKNETIANEELKEINSEYECLEYGGALNKSIFRHIKSGTEGESTFTGIKSGQHPSWSPAVKYNNPSNEKLCIIYFCKTKTYGNFDKHKNGPYLTVGITTRDAKERYQGNGHIKTFHEFETYNCNIHEKSLLEQITALLGKPEAGNEAWQWSQNREDTIKKLFIDHFLKDYIEPLDIKHTIMP